MFQNDCYTTRGVQATVSAPLQLLLWYLIDSMDAAEKDWLQVFELEPAEKGQRIIHTQEKPPYRNEHALRFGDVPLRAKLFVIDDGDHSTMLLADEY